MSKITESARGEECQVRIPGVCNHNPETTVFAHLGGGGMGAKQPDCEGAYSCSSCHDVVDGRAGFDLGDIMYFLGADPSIATPAVQKMYLENSFHEACVRTRKILIDKGLLILK